MVVIEGEKRETKTYAIVLGQSEGSKGVMFTLYAFPKGEYRTPTNMPVYLGTLADDMENAVTAAKRLVPGTEVEVWEEETVRERKKYAYGFLDFGKYKDQHIEDVLDTDPRYFWWMINNRTFYGQFRELVESYREIVKTIVISQNSDSANPPLVVNTIIDFKTLEVTAKENMGAYRYGSKPTYKYTLKDEEGNKFVLNTTVDGERISKLIVTGNFSTKMGYVFNTVKCTK